MKRLVFRWYCLPVMAGVVLLARAVGGVFEWGTVNFNNRVPLAGVDAPVYGTDGVTRLEGAGYRAQLWAGLSSAELEPVGVPVEFRTGLAAGYFAEPGGTLVIPQVPAGSVAFLQVRAWDTAYGGSYEVVLASGGPTGASPVFSVRTGGDGSPPTVPADLVGLQSFSLEVRTNVPPVFVRQPEGEVAYVGQPVLLRVEVAPTNAELQWLKDGLELPGATGPRLEFGAILPVDAGSYQVRVSNEFGSRLSDPALISVRSAPAGASLRFSNRLPAEDLDAPVLHADGQTRVSGPESVAQLWVGRSADALEPAMAAVPLASGVLAGYFESGEPIAVTLPGVTPGQPVLAQVRVWGQPFDDFETARANGGWVGFSTVIEVITGGAPDHPAPASLTGLTPIVVGRIPVITESPEAGSFPVGFAARVEVVVESSEPVAYEWLKDGEVIPAAGAAALTWDPLLWEDAGTYQVRVSNRVGVVTSPPFELTVFELVSGGTILFETRYSPFGVDVPVFLEDGVTLASGPGFLAQLYGGATEAALAALGAPVTLLSGTRAGYVSGGVRFLEDVPPRGTAAVQMRVWETMYASFEEAKAWGGRIGMSAILEVQAGGWGDPPAVLAGMPGFMIHPSGPVIIEQPYETWIGVGEPVGFRCGVELTPDVQLQWQFQPAGGGDWQDVPGATAATLQWPSSTLEQNETLYRLIATDQWGSTVSDAVALNVVPLMAMGDQEGVFVLRLLAGAGTEVSIEFSSDLEDWVSIARTEATGTALEFQENPETRVAFRRRFYRARSVGTGEVASENIAGFIRLVLPPDLNLITVPLLPADPRVPAVFAGVPEGTVLYEYDPEAGYSINSREFDEWFDPGQRVEPGRGYYLLTPTGFAPDLTLAGDLPRGDLSRTLPAGWSIQGLPLPFEGVVDEDFFLPLDPLDMVAFWRPATWSLNVFVNWGIGWEGNPPTAHLGEGFWVYRSSPAEWHLRYDDPP